MKISNHKLDGASFVASKHTGGKIEPSLIVLHDTAGRLDPGSSVNWLKDNPSKVSAHVVIERDGSITQLVPFNRRANHAGRSTYHGQNSCNQFSIGIEIVNPGKLRPLGNDTGVAWWGQVLPANDDKASDLQVIEYASTDEHGSGVWMDYTEAQVAAVIALCHTLIAKYPDITDVRGHWYVSPGRKVDPNPLFPMEQVRGLLFEEHPSYAGFALDGDESLGLVETGGSALNMREWPSFNPNVILGIPTGTKVLVHREAVIEGRSWSQVSYGGQTGWVVSRYIDPVE